MPRFTPCTEMAEVAIQGQLIGLKQPIKFIRKGTFKELCDWALNDPHTVSFGITRAKLKEGLKDHPYIYAISTD